MKRLRRAVCGLAVGIFVIGSAGAVRAAVDVEWRPIHQTARAGDVVSVGLFAASGVVGGQSFRSMSAVVAWDPAKLELVGVDDSQNGYAWLLSYFPNDAHADRLNEDCGDAVYCSTYSGRPFNDGDAYFEALARFAPAAMPEAGAGGLRVTAFRFRVLDTGPSQVRLIASTGGISRTRVVGADASGVEVTGQVGAAALVDVVAVTAGDLLDFLSCLRGPGVIVSSPCRRFDADGDIDVDLHDARAFQNAFSSPGGP